MIDASPDATKSSSEPRADTDCAVARSTANGVSAHILPSSATMVGVCMTVLSIGKLAPGGALGMLIDKLLALDSIVFLISAILSFVSLRQVERALRLERRAEIVFLWGLGLLAAAAVIIAFAID